MDMTLSTPTLSSCRYFPITELAVICDRDFFIPSVVMLTSAKLSKSPESRYRVHCFLTFELPEWMRLKLLELASEDFIINIIPTTLTKQEIEWDTERRYDRISGTTMVRLRLPELLPTVDKLLYLDGDMLVMKDLSALYREDVSNATIGAVYDMCGVLVLHAQEALGVSHYVNAGVLLMNLKRLREERLFEPERVSAVMNLTAVEWLDQDVINILCSRTLHLLPPRYNAQISLNVESNCFGIEDFNHLYETHYESLCELEDDAVIIHMCGSLKPWVYDDVFFSELWMDFYKKSPLGHLSLRRTSQSDFRVQKHYFLGFLPIMKIVKENNIRKYKLFNMVPLLKIKGTN